MSVYTRESANEELASMMTTGPVVQGSKITRVQAAGLVIDGTYSFSSSVQLYATVVRRNSIAGEYRHAMPKAEQDSAKAELRAALNAASKFDRRKDRRAHTYCTVLELLIDAWVPTHVL